MLLLGSTFLGGDLACAMTPTGITDINYVEIKNGIYDDLYLTKATDFELSNECPKAWDFDTCLYAPFSNNTNAGNVDWNLETVSHLVIKRRTIGEFNWITLETKEIHALEDFQMNGVDYTNVSGADYEYAVVPVLYGVEGNYSTSQVHSYFSGVIIIERDKSYHTDITDGFGDYTRNIPSATIELLNSKYPVFIRNSIANYDTGTFTGNFMPASDGCTFDTTIDGDFSRVSYQREIMDIISDGIPKLLKFPDGRAKLVQVTPNPTDNADTVYNNRVISFSWVEIGDINSEEDLYQYGYINATEEWWIK